MAASEKKRTGLLVVLLILGFLLLLGGTMAFTVASARHRAATATPTPSLIPTAEPTATPLPNYHSLAFDPELNRMEGMEAAAQSYAQQMDRSFWVDVTPQEAPAGYTLFRHVSLGYSFLLFPDGSYLRLGEDTEGCGVVNGLFADLDADEEPELVFAYTAETETGPCARVGWVNLQSRQVRTGAFLLEAEAMALGESEGRLLLYRASLTDTDSRGFYAIDFLAPLGELIEQNEELFLLLW